MSNVSNSFANGTYIKPPHQIHHELYSEPAKIVTYSLVYGLIASVGLVGKSDFPGYVSKKLAFGWRFSFYTV